MPENSSQQQLTDRQLLEEIHALLKRAEPWLVKAERWFRTPGLLATRMGKKG
jgi:hypothetical protein